MKYIMLYLLHPYKKRYTLATHNDIEYHLYFNVSKVYLAYLLRKDQKYTFWTNRNKFLEFIRHLETSIIPKFEVFRSI